MNENNFQKNQVFKTGAITFVIFSVHEVTQWFSKIEMVLLDSGYFEEWTWITNNQELQKGLDCGKITFIGVQDEHSRVQTN